MLRQRCGLTVNIPAYLEDITLEPGKAPKVHLDASVAAAKTINWALLLSETEGKLGQLKAGLSGVDQKPWPDQTEIREQILDLNKRFLQLISQL